MTFIDLSSCREPLGFRLLVRLIVVEVSDGTKGHEDSKKCELNISCLINLMHALLCLPLVISGGYSIIEYVSSMLSTLYFHF